MLEDISQKIKEEITQDLEGLGYAGKTNAEVMDLLNEPYKKSRIVVEEYPPRILSVLMGLTTGSFKVNRKDMTNIKKEVILDGK